MTVKSRKVGNAMVLTIPAELKVPQNTEFEPYVDEAGNVIFKRVKSQLTEEETEDIHMFMDQFQPLLQKLKDR
ncbi:hypothetical protein IWT140_01901 [Secundilactobacillus pentosiphilus]|uniref:AbrB family transcriptional regulator n=1 Tax=Secundilactobacillus pentosiphilus TaxID=1714682 RepID=A0A1Z5IR68_9LACO|nr:hypothetical protein [Secundilactobacillus pentosiphilus]GAX04263.1 hypothetical protein IWT140_01901 [Secundilactobacillus pentosiphilus]GAX06587.1 hypothetical protein IWT25_01932 [Secundilactobacillus pentosiphilus]